VIRELRENRNLTVDLEGSTDLKGILRQMRRRASALVV
jgi:hypothetical protein